MLILLFFNVSQFPQGDQEAVAGSAVGAQQSGDSGNRELSVVGQQLYYLYSFGQ